MSPPGARQAGSVAPPFAARWRWALVAASSALGDPLAGWSRGWPVLEDWGLVVETSF